jgi:hypothetical protein
MAQAARQRNGPSALLAVVNRKELQQQSLPSQQLGRQVLKSSLRICSFDLTPGQEELYLAC